jgi:hypothetical protein
LSEKSDEERLGGVAAKSENSSNKGMVDLSDASDTDVKPDGDPLRCGQRDSKKDDVAYAEQYGTESKVATDNWVTETGLEEDSKHRDGCLIGKWERDVRWRGFEETQEVMSKV